MPDRRQCLPNPAQIAAGLEKQGVPAGMADKEIVALIAYLQRLGVDWKTAPQQQAQAKEVN